MVKKVCIDFGSSHLVIMSYSNGEYKPIEYFNRQSIPMNVFIAELDGEIIYFVGNEAETKHEIYARSNKKYAYVTNIKSIFSDDTENESLKKMGLTTKQAMTGVIKNVCEKYLSNYSDTEFILTVPTLYNHNKISEYREICHNAGIYKCHFVIESVAACLYSITISTIEESYYSITMDGGEKTLDLSLLKIEKNKISEISHKCIVRNNKSIAGFTYTFYLLRKVVLILEKININDVQELIDYYNNNNYDGLLTVNTLIKNVENMKILILSKNCKEKKIETIVNKYKLKIEKCVHNISIETTLVEIDVEEYLNSVKELNYYICNSLISFINSNYKNIEEKKNTKIIFTGGLFYDKYLTESVKKTLKKKEFDTSSIIIKQLSTCVATGAIIWSNLNNLKIEHFKMLPNKYAFKLLDDEDKEKNMSINTNSIIIGNKYSFPIYGDDIYKTRNIYFPIIEISQNGDAKLISEIEFPNFFVSEDTLKKRFEDFEKNLTYNKQFSICVSIQFEKDYNILVEMENNIKYIKHRISSNNGKYIDKLVEQETKKKQYYKIDEIQNVISVKKNYEQSMKRNLTDIEDTKNKKQKIEKVEKEEKEEKETDFNDFISVVSDGFYLSSKELNSLI